MLNQTTLEVLGRDSVALRRLGACFNQGNPSMYQNTILKDVFLDSTYRGYRGHFPDIAIATAKFTVSCYRDDRYLSLCLVCRHCGSTSSSVVNTVYCSVFGKATSLNYMDVLILIVAQLPQGCCFGDFCG